MKRKRDRFGHRGLKTYWIRLGVQAAFTLTVIWIGIAFARFSSAIEHGLPPYPTRPPGVEGFLPISGLMGALDWIYQGRLNSIHPAATILFLAFTLLALLLRKSFCTWICPIGLLSESLARAGRRLLGRNFRPWVWVDIILRGLKYLILGFFLVSILKMSATELQGFIHGSYNRASDLKMLAFFSHLDAFAIWTLVVLTLGSLLVNGFWCRYLCPYGAWLGLFSWLSPLKIRRQVETCTDCGLCDRACMARLPVASKTRIISPECTGCLDCVASCPVPETLALRAGRRRVTPLAFAGGLLAIFLVIYITARLSGYWQNSIGDVEYLQLFRIMGDLSH